MFLTRLGCLEPKVAQGLLFSLSHARSSFSRTFSTIHVAVVRWNAKDRTWSVTGRNGPAGAGAVGLVRASRQLVRAGGHSGGRLNDLCAELCGERRE
jgi:hypothetical protein